MLHKVLIRSWYGDLQDQDGAFTASRSQSYHVRSSWPFWRSWRRGIPHGKNPDRYSDKFNLLGPLSVKMKRGLSLARPANPPERLQARAPV